jgi:hypothetical protein
MQQKTIFTLGIALILTISSLSNSSLGALAASPSPTPSLSPTPTPISEETVTENLKKRLQETISGEDKVEPDLVQYKSFVGVIRDVIKNTLVIEDKDGKKNVMILSDASIVRSPGNATIKAESIRIEDYVIAIGTLRESDELESVRVIVSTEPLTTVVKKAEAGKISKLTTTTLTIIPLNGSENKTITLNAKTSLKSSLGESLETKELSVGDAVIYTAIESKNALTATSIMRIGFADPSATLTPAPSPEE